MANRLHLAACLISLGWFLAPAAAADLSQIDRRISKEPAYQSKPKYCLLVFGPEAKTRVWLAWIPTGSLGPNKVGRFVRSALNPTDG